MDVEWYESSAKEVNKMDLIKNYSIDCKMLRLSSTGLYKTERLRRLFQIIMTRYYVECMV